MDARVDGRAAEWTGGRADGRADGRLGGRPGGRAGGRAGGRTGGRTGGRADSCFVAHRSIAHFCYSKSIPINVLVPYYGSETTLKCLRMEFSIVERLSGPEGIISIIFRSPNLNHGNKIVG